MQSFIKSFFYALNGLCYSWSMGRNFRIQIVLGVVAFSLCFAFRVERWEWIVVSILTGGVLALETLNSAVETLCNHITLEQDPKASKNCLPTNFMNGLKKVWRNVIWCAMPF